jgi:predicted dehydrogenase
VDAALKLREDQLVRSVAVHGAHAGEQGDRDSGLVLGHRAFAQYGFTRCVLGEMSFHAWERTLGYGLDLVGSRGQLALRGSRMDATLWQLPTPEINPARDPGPWRPVELPSEPTWGSEDDSVCVMYRHLLHSIETGEPHPSSGDVGRDALEMVMAIYESHRRGARVALPLADRRHPLEVWRAEERLAG